MNDDDTDIGPLPDPDFAMRPSAAEILSLWICPAENDASLSLRVAAIDDPYEWGQMLGDIALRVVETAFESGINPPDVLREIIRGFRDVVTPLFEIEKGNEDEHS